MVVAASRLSVEIDHDTVQEKDSGYDQAAFGTVMATALYHRHDTALKEQAKELESVAGMMERATGLDRRLCIEMMGQERLHGYAVGIELVVLARRLCTGLDTVLEAQVTVP